jgi:hypothetical protein
MTTHELLVQLQSSLDNTGASPRTWGLFNNLKKQLDDEDDIGGMEITDTMQAWALGTVLAVTLLVGLVVGALIW